MLFSISSVLPSSVIFFLYRPRLGSSIEERSIHMTLEQRAHDLAILYMQMEIKHEQITLADEDDFQNFVDEYQHCYSEMIRQLEEES